MSPKDRIKEGKARRDIVSRTEQARFAPEKRDFDPIQIVRTSNDGRIRKLIPIKYQRMAANPFAFLRGAVAIMAADLAQMPHSGIAVQLCGDAHVQNLGSFATADGRLVFDINDFDETIPGPFEWDVKRMAASVVLAGQAAGQTPAACRIATEAFVESYCRSMEEFAELPILEVARHPIHREKKARPIHAALRQSERANSYDLLHKLTHGGRFRDLSKESASWPIEGDPATLVLQSLAAYRKTLAPERRHLFDLFRPVAVGFKVVGTGSVGLENYAILFEGSGPRDPMFLQVKQAKESAYAKYLPHPVYRHQGQRVVEGQRAIQPSSDLLLGWTSIGEENFLVRQLNDRKGEIRLERLRGAGLRSLAVVAGELLARGHARSGDACTIHGYCGRGAKFAHAIQAFASSYADQTIADHAAFVSAFHLEAYVARPQ